VLKCCGHLIVLGSLPMDVHVLLEYVVVTLVLLVHCYERSRSAEVCCGHLRVLGSLPMDVHVGLEYVVVTLVLLVHCFERYVVLKCAVVTSVFLVHCLWTFT